MTLAELKTAFVNKFPSGSPSYHYGTAPNGTKLPYVVVNDGGSDNFEADNIVYQPIQGVVLNLYTLKKNESLEANIESLLGELEIVWSKSEATDEDQNFVLNTYTFNR